MKLLIFVFTLFLCHMSFAQGVYTEAQRNKDKAKLDSICRKSPSTCLYYGDIFGRNSIFRNHTPKKIEPRQRICFNKKFHYMSTNNGKTTRGCFYINTETGYVAMFMSHLDESCKGMGNPQPGFDMMIISKVGESFIYRINKNGKKMFMAQMPPENITYGGQTNFVLNKPSALGLAYREPFTNQNLPTLAYKIEGSGNSSLRYLFGAYHAQRIPLKDFIGAFGLGYYKDSHSNTFICLAMENKDHFVKVEKIENTNECFDGSAFGDMIAEGLIQNEAIIKDKEKRLNEDKGNSDFINECGAAKSLEAHKKQMLEKEKRLNIFVKNGGNIHGQEGLKLAAKAQDVIDQVITERLNVEIRLCKLKNAKFRNDIAKRECLNLSIPLLNVLIKELEGIDAKHGTNYAQASAEKNILFFRRMKDIDVNCNFNRDGSKNTKFEKGAERLGEMLKEKIKRKQ